MRESSRESPGAANGVAALSILKMLLDVMNKKDLLTDEEVNIILSCAKIDIQSRGKGLPTSAARQLIDNLFDDEDPITTIA